MLKTISSLIAASLLLFSCNQSKESEGKPEAVTKTADTPSLQIPAGTELWAEQVESQTDMLQPADWSDADWNATYKQVDKEKIFNTILDGIKSGKLTAYDYFHDTVSYSVKEIESMLHYKEEIEVEDEEAGKVEKKTREGDITSKEIAAIKVKEKWFFDKQNFKMYKEVTDLAFFVNSYTGDGLVRGIKPLFYVNLNAKPNS